MLPTFLLPLEIEKKKKNSHGICVTCWCNSRHYKRYHQPVLSVLTSAQPLGGASVIRFAQIDCMHYFCVALYLSLSLFLSSPRWLTFTWWGYYGLCPRHKLTELAHPFLFRSSVCFCLYGPFNCIPFHEFPRQLSVFSLYSSGLISALLVLSAIYLFVKVSFSPAIIPSGCLGSKHQ